MTKEKAIHFLEIEDSLSFFKQKLNQCDILLKDCQVSLGKGGDAVKKLMQERDLHARKVNELQESIGIFKDKNIILSSQVESLAIKTKELETKHKKIKVQRDILIGVGSATVIMAVVSIIIAAI
jgi:chromosome segregation ATPase